MQLSFTTLTPPRLEWVPKVRVGDDIPSDMKGLIRFRLFLFFSTYLWLGGPGLLFGTPDSLTNANFRAFLSHPTRIQILIFHRKDYPELPLPKPPADANGSVYVFFNDTEFSAVWEEDAFYVTPVISKDFALTNSHTVITKSDLDWTYGASHKGAWFTHGGQFTKYNGALQDQDIGVPVHDNARKYRNQVLEVIHLGIANLRNGSLKWSGDEWEGLDLSGTKISGRGIFNDSGRVSKMDYSVEGSRVKFTVEYFYDINPEDGDTETALPHHFRRIQHSANPAESPDLVEAEFTIRRIVAAPTSIEQTVLAREQKEKDVVESARTAPIFEETTNGTVFVDQYNVLHAVEATAKVHQVSTEGHSKSRVALFILLLSGGGGLALIFFIVKTHKHS